MRLLKSTLYFLFILFLELACGLVLAMLYWALSSSLFPHEFEHSRINEGIYYIVTLLPPFTYCFMEYLSLKRKGDINNAIVYLSAGITYLAASLIFMLILTNFYLFNG